MNEAPRDVAQRVVNRLLDDDGASTSPPVNDRPVYRAPARTESCTSKPCKPAKAWKQGKKTAGQSVASKPGKVSYRESLMKSVLEKLKMKKAGKGAVCAKAPGKVSYRKESAVLEKKMGTGIKGGSAKKLVGAIAKKPGKVAYGKR